MHFVNCPRLIWTNKLWFSDSQKGLLRQCRLISWWEREIAVEFHNLLEIIIKQYHLSIKSQVINSKQIFHAIYVEIIVSTSQYLDIIAWKSLNYWHMSFNIYFICHQEFVRDFHNYHTRAFKKINKNLGNSISEANAAQPGCCFDRLRVCGRSPF